MAVLILGTLAVVLSATTINVAIVPIMAEFGIGHQSVQLLSTVYLGATVVTAPLAAWLTRRVGAAATFQGILILYFLASIGAALSPSFSALVLARAIQGGCAGIIQPLSMFLLLEAAQPMRRGRAMSAYGFGVVLAPAMGPTVAGWFVDHLGWWSAFLIGPPLSLAAQMLARGHLAGRPEVGLEAIHGFDWAGLILLASLVTLVFMFPIASSLSEAWGWGMLGAGIVNIIVLVSVERLKSEPLLVIGLFASTGFRRIAMIAMCYGIGLYGATFLVPIYLQAHLGVSAKAAGNIMFAGGVALAITILLSGHWVDRYSGRRVLRWGLAIFALSCLLLAFETWRESMSWVSAAVAIGRIGLGLIIPALSTAVIHEIGQEHLRDGTGGVNLFRQMGGTIGIAGIGALLAAAPGSPLFEAATATSPVTDHLIYSAGFSAMFLLFVIASFIAGSLRKI